MIQEQEESSDGDSIALEAKRSVKKLKNAIYWLIVVSVSVLIY